MKIISLNTWGGRAGIDTLLAFFKRYKDVDVFCLQEVWEGCEQHLGTLAGGVPLREGICTTLLSDISKVLRDHDMHFRPHIDDCYGLVLFIKKDIPVSEEGEHFVYRERGWVAKHDIGDHARNIQYATVENTAGSRAIVNFHGLWKKGTNKMDCPERIEQSEKTVSFLKTLSAPLIFLGDFNLLPETESLKKFEQFGLRNLISEYRITSTRTHFYEKPVKHADYALVGNEVNVMDFKVLPDVVSDHAPLFLDCE